MANAKQCDRCKKFYKSNNNPGYVVRYWNGVTMLNDRDLCPDCEKKLADFMINVEEEK